YVATFGCDTCGVVLESRYFGESLEELIVEAFSLHFADAQSPTECLRCHAVEDRQPERLSEAAIDAHQLGGERVHVDGRSCVVAIEQPPALSEVGVSARLLLRVVSLIEHHAVVGDDDWSADLAHAP